MSEETNQHTTHFDDCGCLTLKYKERIDSLEKKLDICKKYIEVIRKETIQNKVEKLCLTIFREIGE